VAKVERERGETALRWIAFGAVGGLALLGVLTELRIEHGSGHVRLDTKVEVSSSSGIESGVVVEFVHRDGGAFGIPRITRRRVCVTDVRGRCEGELDYRFEGERIRFVRSWPKPMWWFEISSQGKVVATRQLSQSGGYLAGVPYRLKVQIP